MALFNVRAVNLPFGCRGLLKSAMLSLVAFPGPIAFVSVEGTALLRVYFWLVDDGIRELCSALMDWPEAIELSFLLVFAQDAFRLLSTITLNRGVALATLGRLIAASSFLEAVSLRPERLIPISAPCRGQDLPIWNQKQMFSSLPIFAIHHRHHHQRGDLLL